MPLPKTKDVGKLLTFLKSDKPGWSKGQRLAVALETARRAGAKISKKK
jgi:hypothetical protein